MSESQNFPCGKTEVGVETGIPKLENFANPKRLKFDLWNIPQNMFDAVDATWWLFGSFSVSAQISGLSYIILPQMEVPKVVAIFLLFLIWLAMLFHGFLLGYVSFIFKFERCRCLGSVRKLVVEVVTLSVTMALREFVEYNPGYLVLFMGFIADAHIFARCMRVAYDVSVWEIVLALLLQPLVYFAGGNWYILFVVCMLCGAISLYQFVTYSPPVMPVDTKEELKELLC